MSRADGEPVSLLTWPFLALVRVYQRFISPLFPATCRFYPSCSAYSVTALSRFGVVKGLWLTVRRLVRCHPWNPGGVDHVPSKSRTTSKPTASAHVIAKDD